MWKILTAILIFTFSVSYTQNVALNTLTTAGDFAQSKNGTSLSWTIGEVFSQTIEEEYHVTGGFQQGALEMQLDRILTANRQDEAIDLLKIETIEAFPEADRITLFPNPTVSDIKIRFNSPVSEAYSIVLLDQTGRTILMRNVISGENQTIRIGEVENLPPSVYTVSIRKNGKMIESKQFVKSL